MAQRDIEAASEAETQRCTNLTDVCGIVVAFFPFFIGGWALFRLTSPTSFYVLMLTSVSIACFSGCHLWRWVRPKSWPTTWKVVSTVFLSTAVTASAGSGILYFEYITRHPQLEQSWFWRAALAQYVIALDTSLAIVFVHHSQILRKFWSSVAPSPQPQLLLCESLDTAASGNCAICLDRLSCLAHELAAVSDCNEAAYGRGLLTLPCKHTFHASCAEAWLVANGTCPMCRQRCDEYDMGRCTRICLSTKQAGKLSQCCAFRRFQTSAEAEGLPLPHGKVAEEAASKAEPCIPEQALDGDLFETSDGDFITV